MKVALHFLDRWQVDRDRALQRIARALLCDGDEPNAAEVNLRNFFETNWGLRDGAHLSELAHTLQQEVDNPERMVNRTASNDHPNQLAAQLECSLLAWRPPSAPE
jgi:hypothetical protein